VEKLGSYLVNIDFEEQLHSDTFSPVKWRKINRELEYLFFWDAKQGQELWSPEVYDQDYKNYVEDLTGYRPKTTSLGSHDYCWWGDLETEHRFKTQKVLNSKVKCAEIRRDIGLESYPSFICRSQEEISSALEKMDKKFVIKEDYAFSGRGLHFLHTAKISPPVVVEPWVKRVRDFSLFYNEDQIFCLQTHVNRNGSYKGSLIKNQMSERSSLLAEFDKIEAAFNKLGSDRSERGIQVDAFQYLEDSQLKFQFLGEVNHRRTLGKVFARLHMKFGNDHSFLGLIPTHHLNLAGFSENLKNIGKYGYNPITKSGVILLSPGTSNFSFFFFTEESERTLQFLIRDSWKVLVNDTHRLPAEFIVYL
jgi:hypothetical protein